MTFIFTELVNFVVQGTAEVRHRVRDFLAELKIHCINWWSSVDFFTFWSGCCLFDRFPISILYFIKKKKLLIVEQ